MANDPQSITLPQINKGLVLKREIGSLQPGEYATNLNVTSIQEGSIQARLGSERFSNANSFQIIHSFSKLSLGGADASNPRYFGESTNLWRVTGPYSTYAIVSTGLALSAGRWEAASCNSGILSSTPNLFIAHPTRPLRDTGAYTTLRRWGIPPPIAPVICGLGAPEVVILTNQSSGTDQLSGLSVTSASVINGSYYKITPNSMTGILQGMLVLIGSQYVVVDEVDTATFNAYCSTVPSGSIHSYYNPVATPTTPTANGTTFYQDFSGSVNWAFGGLAADGYSSNDNVAVELYVSNWSYVSEIRVRVYLNGSANDYYEQAISPPSTLAYNQQQATATATQQAEEEAILAASLALTKFNVPVSTPNITPFVAPSQAAAQWVEYTLSKANFQEVGNAGSGPFNWSNVTDVRIVIITATVSGAPSFSVNVGAIYAIGGQGPDSITVSTAQPYNYLFTYRDPLTGNEGNAGAAQIPSAWVNVQNRAVQVTCWGTDTSAAGDPTLAGPNTISVYRAGGTFADALYRFVGYATNPGVMGGVPQNVVFTDNQPDEAIAGNQILETDNFPPVPSSMPVPFSATLASVTAFGDGFYTLTFSGLPGGATNLTQFLQPGSQLTLGISSDNQEIVYVQSVTSGSILAYIQQAHFAGEQCLCETFPNAPCDIICTDGAGAVLLAGDPNNPYQVYRSKAGEPTSFPVVNNETGNAHILQVGSPSNPIMGMVNMNGEIVCLNLSKIFTFTIWYGAMSTPVDSGASRGMVGKHLWAKVGDSLWYLSYDGIYGWAGGGSQSMTEQIRTVFDGSGITLNGFAPLDYTQLQNVHLEYFSKYFYIQYVDTSGAYQVLRCSILDNNRWERFQYSSAALPGALTAMMTETDTGRFIGGVYDNTQGKSFLAQLELGSSDAWSGSPSGGSAISWNFQGGFFPQDNRDIEKLFTDVIIEYSSLVNAVNVSMYYDYSTTADSNDQFTLPNTGGARTFIPLPLQQSGSPETSEGKQARVASIAMSGQATNGVVIYSIQFKYKVLAPIQRGRIEDWQDLGHPFDKRLYACTIEYDTGGQNVTLVLDALAGISGGQEFDNIQQFVLDGGRSKQEFPIIDGQIAKMVRLRPLVSSTDFKVFDVQWAKEDYPKDIIYFTEYDDCGSPYDKYLQQVVLDVNTSGLAVSIQIEVDGSVLETISVTSTLDTRSQIVTLNTPLKGKKFRLLLNTPLTTGAKFQLWKAQYVAVPADKGPVSHTGDWMDFGSPNDKHLKVITVTYENAAGLVLQLDSLIGVGVTTEHDAVATFTLSGTGSGATQRVEQQFAVPNSVLAAKAFRLRPQAGSVPNNFKLWGWDAPDKEVYPPDAVLWTELRDFEYPHSKYAQQLFLDVDTGGQPATVQVLNEAGVAQTVTVNSTYTTRQQILTLDPQLAGFKFQLLITPGSSNKFQMWSWRIGFLPADKGPVVHSFDYDDLGYPYSKQLQEITLEYDNGGSAFTMEMDILAADGITILPAQFSFLLNGGGRGKQTFPFPDGTYATMIRLYPVSTVVGLKEWKYVVKKFDYPPNTTLFTEPDNLGWACEKVVRGVTIDINTGGVNCTVGIIMDGVQVQTFVVNSTATDRVRILTVDPNQLGKLFHLTFSPGTGGQAQIFGKVAWDAWKEPCYRTYWNSAEQVLGQAGWHLLKIAFLEYICASSLTFNVYTDYGALFYSVTLPAHAQRDSERFFFPAINNGVLNKSKRYTFEIIASSPFKIYPDGSRIDAKMLSNDQRAAYNAFRLWETMSPQSGA
jgi:hypothetical protein